MPSRSRARIEDTTSRSPTARKRILKTRWDLAWWRSAATISARSHTCNSTANRTQRVPGAPCEWIDKSVWIVSLPYPSGRPGTTSEEKSRSDTDYVAGTIKCRIHGLKGARKKGTNTDHDDCVGCDGKVSTRRHRVGRHRRQRRRRLGKIPEKTSVDKTLKNEDFKGSSTP